MVESVNTDELVQAIADAVLKRLEPIFSNTANGAAQQVKSRRDMAEHIGCSESTLDRMRADGMPSLMVGGTTACSLSRRCSRGCESRRPGPKLRRLSVKPRNNPPSDQRRLSDNHGRQPKS